jgi:hypothetical protein
MGTTVVQVCVLPPDGADPTDGKLDVAIAATVGRRENTFALEYGSGSAEPEG